ncbi:uncharacterized protein LOC121202558, partial [Tachysurus ichikawai]
MASRRRLRQLINTHDLSDVWRQLNISNKSYTWFHVHSSSTSAARSTRDSFRTVQLWWDYGKIQIRQLCQQYTLSVTKELTRSTKEAEISQLQELVEATGKEAIAEQLAAKKCQWLEMLEVKAQGALVQSRFLNVNQLDVPTKYFFSLEKKNGQNRFLHALRSEAGVLLSDKTDIKKRAVDFYKGLYKSEVSSEAAQTVASTETFHRCQRRPMQASKVR